MRKENRRLLEEVLKDRLEVMRQAEAGSDESTAATKEAMEIVDRLIKIDENEIERLHHEREDVDKVKTDRFMLAVRIAEVGCAVAVPFMYYVTNSGLIRQLSEFEKDYNWTMSAGQALRNVLYKK